MKDTSREYLAMLSHLFLRNGKIQQARIILEGMAVLAPGDFWVHRTLAYAYLQEERFQDCLAQLDRAGGRTPENLDRVIRVRALWGLGRHDEARKILSEMHGKLRD